MMRPGDKLASYAALADALCASRVQIALPSTLTPSFKAATHSLHWFLAATTGSFFTAKTGEILVIGGIQRRSNSRSTNRLGPIPIIGDLMRYTISPLLSRLKKGLIERQCHGLLEFVEPRWTLDDVIGRHADVGGDGADREVVGEVSDQVGGGAGRRRTRTAGH